MTVLGPNESILDPREAALGTEGLVRRFGEVTAVDDVTLAVPSGELRAVIGPNGAGKTTLFNVVTGLLSPTAGRVWFEGTDVTDAPQYERPHAGLARSFQSNELFTEESVLENVRVVVQTAEYGPFGLDLFRDAASVGRERAVEILDRVGLDAAHDTLAKNLPHGDQRRLGIAMALATDPDVLLLDEPTSGMSPGATTKTAALVEDIHDSLGLTVLLIEHDMDVVLSISDRVTVLDQGRAIATGPPEEIRTDDDVQEAYLGGIREEL
ncbi:ABC transporter ATP-binding protein [Salinirarus marinus]|uniref:ABC transporter ATP-binding protein n=1 Tax=Salinirarus marinus TaxID=3068310 RepID=UPI003C6CA008